MMEEILKDYPELLDCILREDKYYVLNASKFKNDYLINNLIISRKVNSRIRKHILKKVDEETYLFIKIL